GVRTCDRPSGEPVEDRVHQHRLQFRCTARRELQSLHVPHRGRELDVRDGGRPVLAAREPRARQEVVLADGRLRLRPRPSAGCEEIHGGEWRSIRGRRAGADRHHRLSPYLLKVRQARPDLVVSNLAGNQITSFLKQYSEYGLPFPVAGFGFDTVVAWGAGKGNFSGIWPLVWHHLVDTPSSKKYVEVFQKKYGKLPDNQSWGDYNSLKIVAQSMGETKSTDPQKLAEHLRKGAK